MRSTVWSTELILGRQKLYSEALSHRGKNNRKEHPKGGHGGTYLSSRQRQPLLQRETLPQIRHMHVWDFVFICDGACLVYLVYWQSDFKVVIILPQPPESRGRKAWQPYLAYLKILWMLLFIYYLGFQDDLWLCSSDWLPVYDFFPASVSPVLGLQEHTILPDFVIILSPNLNLNRCFQYTAN